MKLLASSFFLLVLLWSTAEVKALGDVNVNVVPADAVKYAVGKVDSWFSCSKYDGFAPCFHRNKAKRDRICSESSCRRKDMWQYKPKMGGTCYCCKCWFLAVQKIFYWEFLICLNKNTFIAPLSPKLMNFKTENPINLAFMLCRLYIVSNIHCVCKYCNT